MLVIEDDQDVGNVFRMALEYAGYKVMLVNDVTKALGVVFQGMPDAIILDLMVPDMNGLDLVRYVRKQKTPKHIPMLVVSGAIGGFQTNQALAGGRGYVPGQAGRRRRTGAGGRERCPTDARTCAVRSADGSRRSRP